ncbi:MAG TPA: hypothetical protein VK465_17150, partial [Fibrobacteria bacterium]|nr:hypothetical protein [Fibrobacteria bacterium]
MSNKIVSALTALALSAVTALANDFSCIGESESYIKEKDLSIVETAIESRLAKGSALTAHDHCVVAELMKRTGDVRAAEHYEAAIEKAPDAAGYELFYAQYLRWTRGAMYPVWHESKYHYNQALKKIAKYKEQGDLKHYQQVIEDWTTRGLIALHESDGLVLNSSPEKSESHFELGYATLNCLNYHEGECGEGDLDKQKVDAVRDYAGEHQFARSLWRAGPVGFDLNGIQKKLLRTKLFKETKHRLRMRTPVATFDAWYAYKHGDDAIIHNYYFPKAFNLPKYDSTGAPIADPAAYQVDPFAPVTVHEYAASLIRPLDLYPFAEFLFTGTFRYIERKGTVEFFGQAPAAGASIPQAGGGGVGFFGMGYSNDGVAIEKIYQYEAGLDWSRFVGPDKIYNENFALFMDIGDWNFQQEGIKLARYRYILASKLDYAFYRPISFPWGRMYTRGWHFRVGAFQDKEFWGSSYGLKQDIYAGTELRGVGGWDFTLQSTLMDHIIYWPPENDPFTTDEIRRGMVMQENTLKTRIHRLNFTPLVRLVDEEVTPGMPKARFLGLRPAFVNLVFPMRWDYEMYGPGDGSLIVQDTLSISGDGKVTTDTRTLAPGTVPGYHNVYAGAEI